jgi:hypothetical protein
MPTDEKLSVRTSELAYSIEPFGDSVREAYTGLFADMPEKLAELSWRFEHPGGGKAQFAVARRADSEIVGLIALTPAPLRGRFGTLRAVQAIDTIVSPLARGKFVFVRLGRIIHDSPMIEADIVWGFPNALAARGWFGKLGWERFGSVPFLVKPLRTGYFLGRLWKQLERVDIPFNVLKPQKDEMIVREIDDRWDQLWNACVPDFGVAVDRTAQWLRWRLGKPGTDYRFAMKVGPDGGEAAVITRIVQKHGAMICYVMEALSAPQHGRVLNRLLKHELRRAAQQGSQLALAWCPKYAPNRGNYSRVGFFSLPDRLRPIQIHFGGRWLASGHALGEDMPGDQWYLSYLDSDTV